MRQWQGRGPLNSEGSTVWLTGLPSSGKSTIANATKSLLLERGVRAEILDGDIVRKHLGAELGFDRESRQVQTYRLGWISNLLAKNGVTTLVAAIAPYTVDRHSVRELHVEAGTTFHEVFISASVTTCSKRDVKGLYARQAQGRMSGLTGIDSPYEHPIAPDLTIRTECETADESARRLLEFLQSRNGTGLTASQVGE